MIEFNGVSMRYKTNGAIALDNVNVKMRALMDRECAMALIERIPHIDVLVVEKEKNRRDTYRAALACAECEEYISIIKTVCLRREEAARQKKRLAESDNDYEKKAKFCLYGELALALELPVSEIERIIETKISGVAV